MMLRLALTFLLASISARAAEPLQFRFAGGSKEIKKADKALVKWLRVLSKEEFPAKTRAIAKNQAISRAQLGVMDMRDAVAALPARGSAAAGPRVAPASEAACADLESCPSRVAATHAEGVGGLPDAVFAAVQPWILLQQRRGGGLSLRAAAEDQGTLATMTLEGLVSVPVDICVSPAPMGGLEVWLRSVADLDDIYAFSREAVLRPSQPR